MNDLHMMRSDFLRSIRWQRVLQAVAALYLVVLFALAVLPMPGPPMSGGDKLGHAAAFALLAVFGCAALPRLHAVFVLGLGIGFGVLIEVTQHFIPYRSAEVADVVADAAGLLLGLAAVAVRRQRATVRG